MRRRRGNIVLGSVKPAKNAEVKYRKYLNSIVMSLEADVARMILPIVNFHAPSYVINDGYGNDLSLALESLNLFYRDISRQAKAASTQFVGNVNSANRDRFSRVMTSAMGIDVGNIINREELSDNLAIATRRNVSLIESIPSEYLKKVEMIVSNSVLNGSPPGGMIKQLRDLTKLSLNRAKLIARDQISKINSELTMQRQLNAGITHYRWLTVGDDRVRPTHVKNNNKIFRWAAKPGDDDYPNETGHTGEDVLCRCIPQGIIDPRTITWARAA